MIKKNIISKINTEVPCKLPQLVRNWLIFLGVAICLITFSVVADEAANTEKKEGEVVQQTEEEPAASVESTEEKKATDSAKKPSSGSDEKSVKVKTEVITGSSDEMDGDEKKGITILIGNAKTVRLNEEGVEIGFLNADKITLIRDPETRQTKEIIAEGNVEIRDQDIFATCEHATMDNLTNIIVLKEKVVVLQNKDRLETKIFTYNRITGKQTGVGGVKFKVTVTQAVPEESEETSSNSEDTPKSDEKAVSPETKKEGEKKSENGSKEADKEEKTTPAETKKEEKTSESESEKDEDKETEPTESEETEPTESEETEPAESEEEADEAEKPEEE